MSSIPLDDPEEFDKWLMKRWREKDALMEQYMVNGRFPSSPIYERSIIGFQSKKEKVEEAGFIETEIKQVNWWDFLQVFVVLGIFGMVANILACSWNLFMYSRFGW
jgi:lysocardiolipin and lysophospholipid acyltransferase